MARLTEPNREELDAAGQQIWDEISGPRGGVHGPYAMLMHVPPLAQLVAQLGEHLRFQGTLPGHVRELAIITTGRSLNAKFEWFKHAPLAVKEGVPMATIEAVRSERYDSIDGHDGLVVSIARSICTKQSLTDDLFSLGKTELGEALLVELITLVSFYTMIADVIRCFDIQLPAGEPAPW